MFDDLRLGIDYCGYCHGDVDEFGCQCDGKGGDLPIERQREEERKRKEKRLSMMGKPISSDTNELLHHSTQPAEDRTLEQL